MRDLAIFPLSHLAFLRVSGSDAPDFLQGQLSSDVRLVTPQRAQISSYNSPKGRMLAVLHLLSFGDAIVLELHDSLREAVHKRLRLFVLRARVTIDDCADDCRALGIAGSGAEAWLRAQGLPLPDGAALAAATRADGLTVLRRFGPTARYSVHGPGALLAALAPAAAHTPDAELHWRRLDIEAGVPLVLPQTVDQFVPQMCNLDRLGGIGLNKGCYTGQEVIARLHYLGTLKRRMFLVRGAGDAPPPGTPVHDGADAAQSAGAIVDAVADGDAFVASAVLQLAHSGSDALRAGDAALGCPETLA